ncbi:MAG TPA: cupredoxin domain-containing protein [Candidatus Paceibacterota bacterium]|nr:cupredoxin domain-containing protein [Candidatus Paceibacterota bacterium]
MKAIIISIIISLLLIGSAFMLKTSNEREFAEGASVDTVSVEDGVQMIEIDAKGGYFPRITKAKAGIPTVLKVATNGTFDCSAALTIPSLEYRKNLPPSGTTEIEVPPQEAGTKLQGLCSMGMYNFSVQFE